MLTKSFVMECSKEAATFSAMVNHDEYLKVIELTCQDIISLQMRWRWAVFQCGINQSTLENVID